MSTPPRTFRRRIGEILVNDGVVTQEQVDEALAIQKETKEPLGAILLDLGAVTESDISRTICVQYQLPFICLANYEIDEKMLLLLPREFMHLRKILPFDKIGNILLAAVAEVPDEIVVAEIARQTQYSVALYIGYLSEISRELNRICPCDVKAKVQRLQEDPETETDSEEADLDEDDSSTLAFGSGKGSFLQELDSTWDSIFETPKGVGARKPGK